MREGSPNPFCTTDPESCSKSLFQNILAASHSFSIFYPSPATLLDRKSLGMSILEGREQKKNYDTIPPRPFRIPAAVPPPPRTRAPAPAPRSPSCLRRISVRSASPHAAL